MECDIDLTSAEVVQVWRADDRASYFCHGLTFGGKDAPGGALTPCNGRGIERILSRFYTRLDDELLAQPGDIILWPTPDPFERFRHSAVIVSVDFAPGEALLGYDSLIRTKNGLAPEDVQRFEAVNLKYGETYAIYRRSDS